MERAERLNNPLEAQQAAFDGLQARIWTALPGIVTAFDPAAMTVSVQPAVMGSIRDEAGKSASCSMPLLVDVPVVFPCGGGFSLTYPVKLGDEALVVFACRCIDGWWQTGASVPPPDSRMHDLSDGFAIVGPRSQAKKLDPAVDAENVQLRTDDGEASITLKPDYTIEAKNPQARVALDPAGALELEAAVRVKIKAPDILLAGNLSTEGYGGGAGAVSMQGVVALDGTMAATGDITAEGKSVAHHTHPGIGEPE